MKKIVSLVVTIALLLSLCACGNSSQATNNNESIPDTEPAVTQAPAAYDTKDKDSIVAFIVSQTEVYEAEVADNAKVLIEQLGNSYESFSKHQDILSAYYDNAIRHASVFYASVQQACIDYYKCMASTGLGSSDDWDNALEELYDVWDDAYEDSYDALDDTYKNVYTACEDLIEDASDKLDYDEYYAIWEALYDSHYAEWEAMYDAHYAAWETTYDNQWAIWEGFYDGNTDVDAILKAAAEEKATKATEATTHPVETEVVTEPTETQPVETEAPTQPPETEAPTQPTEKNNTPATGIRSDFKEAMDAYEEFYAEYCEFLTKYSENPTDFTLIAKYGELLLKAEQMDAAFEKWESEDLTDEELKYYLDVQNRVMKMLVDVM